MFKFHSELNTALCLDNPNSLVVFGDNLIGKGKAGQAVIRDEPNAFGVPTKRLPSMEEGSFFSDQKDEYEIVKTKFNYLWNEHLKGRKIILPEAQIGSGLANIQLYSPKIHELVCRFYASARESLHIVQDDKNLIFLQKFIDLQKNYLSGYKTVQEKYTNGYCQDLVFCFHKINSMNGENIRICETKENNTDILHFVYRSNEGKFYDINGGFDTLEELVEKCSLFSNYTELSIQVDCLEINEDDFEDDWEEVNILLNSFSEPTIESLANRCDESCGTIRDLTQGCSPFTLCNQLS